MLYKRSTNTNDKSKSAIKFSTYLLVSAIYLTIALGMFWPITLDPTHTIVNAGYFEGDVYQSLWGLWWIKYAVFVAHTNIYYTNLLFYPIGANLITETFQPLAGIFFAPFQVISLVFEYNSILISSFVLSGLFMFMLAYYIIKNSYASFIGGLIYAFSPMHIAQSYVHLQWAATEFIPLFILFLLLTIEKHKFKHAFLASLSFLLLTFFGDIEQGIIATVFVIVFLLYIAIKKNEKFYISKKLFFDVFLIYLLVLLLGSPFFIQIVKSLIYSNSLREALRGSSLAMSSLWSNNLLSFFLPSYYNSIFNGFSLAYYSTIFAPDVNEKVSYIGYSVLLLIILAIFYTRKTKAYANVKLWLFIGIFFGFISLGPFILAGKYLLYPGPYILYYFIPFFNLVSEPGRFDVIVTISIAILASVGSYNLFHNLTKKYKKGALFTILLTLIFAALILIEYNGIPSQSMAKAVFIKIQTPQVYSIIAQAPGNYSVLLLPDLPQNTKSPLYQGMGMYFQTLFQKPIFGGYTSRQTIAQEFLPYRLPLSIQSRVLEEGNTNFTNTYPIQENYTYVDRSLVKIYNISFVAVIRQAYKPLEYNYLYQSLLSIFGPPEESDNTTTLFSTKASSENYYYTYPVSYIIGPWDLINGTWWANSTSAISIYAETPSIATMNMSIIANNNTRTYVCMNGMPISELNLSKAYQYFTLNLNLENGVSNITLSTASSCNASNVLIWGTKGIKFTYV